MTTSLGVTAKPVNPRRYFVLHFRFGDVDQFLLWYSESKSLVDGVVLEPDGTCRAFLSEQDARSHASRSGIVVSDEEPTVVHDLDRVISWATQRDPRTIDCVEMLSAWNLFADVARSVSAEFDPDTSVTEHLYDRIFWGNNLPAMTPAGEHFTPTWSDLDAMEIAQIMERGLAIFRDVVVLRT